ncbi:MAG TPA: hypothetical protein VEZ40_15155 [Pyrinomonadaceae bacterium]|nr:hypothetical protein [Pyrinomonadaceae bacterium]
MKAEFDKEIDSVLRERARRGRAASGEPGAGAGVGASSAAHLDADERSAYAENALPAAARAYYTAHLADCDDCRRGVTQLALAAGTAAQLEPREAATGQTAATPRAGWRERLGALLAPRAWRYAVPALALLLVGAVSLIVFMRPSPGESTIAQRSASERQKPGATQSAETHHAPQNGNHATTAIDVPGQSAAVASNANSSAPNSAASLSKEEVAANSERAGGVAPQLDGIVAGDPVAPPAPAPASGGGANAGAASALPMSTPAPVAAAPESAEAKTGSGERTAELARLENRPGDLENRSYENRRREPISGPQRNNEQARNTRTADADEARDRADKQDGNFARNAPPPTAAATAAKSARREADGGRDENRPAQDSERGEGARTGAAVETRHVAGRKFRRQGEAWIDTAYRAGQSQTVVRRNSEQFRALVADEPELRRIAAALGGDVTVVWKGRAYRFR